MCFPDPTTDPLALDIHAFLVAILDPHTWAKILDFTSSSGVDLLKNICNLKIIQYSYISRYTLYAHLLRL